MPHHFPLHVPQHEGCLTKKNSFPPSNLHPLDACDVVECQEGQGSLWISRSMHTVQPRRALFIFWSLFELKHYVHFERAGGKKMIKQWSWNPNHVDEWFYFNISGAVIMKFSQALQCSVPKGRWIFQSTIPHFFWMDPKVPGPCVTSADRQFGHVCFIGFFSLYPPIPREMVPCNPFLGPNMGVCSKKKKTHKNFP